MDLGVTHHTVAHGGTKQCSSYHPEMSWPLHSILLLIPN
uniref:Uncharacterized protein n=1 Tax=Arundo donax TaxID=35708 RepID=A0A0A9A4K4_ARUDO